MEIESRRRDDVEERCTCIVDVKIEQQSVINATSERRFLSTLTFLLIAHHLFVLQGSRDRTFGLSGVKIEVEILIHFLYFFLKIKMWLN